MWWMLHRTKQMHHRGRNPLGSAAWTNCHEEAGHQGTIIRSSQLCTRSNALEHALCSLLRFHGVSLSDLCLSSACPRGWPQAYSTGGICWGIRGDRMGCLPLGRWKFKRVFQDQWIEVGEFATLLDGNNQWRQPLTIRLDFRRSIGSGLRSLCSGW